MTSYDALYLAGTLGYIAFILLGSSILLRWHRDQGDSWLVGLAGQLALALIAALGGFAFIALVRLLTSAHALHATDARIIAGAAPWMAFVYLAGHRQRTVEKR